MGVEEAAAEYDRALKDWAHSYNGYDRIAGGGNEHIANLYRYVQEQIEEPGQIPDWFGVDLLRGWAFWAARCHNRAHMSDGYFRCCDSTLYTIAEAVRRHPAVKPKDMPPAMPNELRPNANA